MSVRERRLLTDREKMQALQLSSDLIHVSEISPDCDRYKVSFCCRGLIWMPGALAPSISANHRCEIYLHLNYPRTPPQVVWLTQIFHPNILPPQQNGGVCIGHWSPAETLDQLCIRLAEMVQMKNFNVNDPLNPTAANWARANISKFPVDNRPILHPEPEIIV